MPHALEIKYGLTSSELLDAIDRRFRLKVALEGAVAEVHFERKLFVLDPFGGSNTTGAVAQDLGRRWLTCEINAAYAEDSRLRFEGAADAVAAANGQPSLLFEK